MNEIEKEQAEKKEQKKHVDEQVLQPLSPRVHTLHPHPPSRTHYAVSNRVPNGEDGWERPNLNPQREHPCGWLAPVTHCPLQNTLST